MWMVLFFCWLKVVNAESLANVRNMVGWKSANSEEFNKSADPSVVVFMPEIDPEKMGGTMRLGKRTTLIRPLTNGKKSHAAILYGSLGR